MRKGTGIFLLVLIVVLGGIAALYFLKPGLLDDFQRKTSDASASADLIRIGGDDYDGYFFISSPEMRKHSSGRGQQKGLTIDFKPDGGKYAQRLQQFKDKQLDAIVLPVDSYIFHGSKHGYPGVIVAAISESKGADGIVAFADKLPSGKVNDLNDAGLRFVYTRDAPSEFLIDLTIQDFGLTQLTETDIWRYPVDDVDEVIQRAKAGDGDVFSLWDPGLSKVLTEVAGIKYVWGSDKFAGYIVDVFVFHRDFIKKKPDVVKRFLTAYYQTLGIYKRNKELMYKHMKKNGGIKDPERSSKRIKWYDLRENMASQLGVALNVGDPVREGLADTIMACTDVMIHSGKLNTDPLKGNPYSIINSKLIEELGASTRVMSVCRNVGKVTFSPLNDSDWLRLNVIGSLRIQPITFQLGRKRLDVVGKAIVSDMAKRLGNNYAQYRVIIRGHTGPGDEAANKALSLERAQVVRQYLVGVHSIHPNRIFAEGVGSQYKDEVPQTGGRRAWLGKLARVEFILVEANLL